MNILLICFKRNVIFFQKEREKFNFQRLFQNIFSFIKILINPSVSK